MTVLLDTNAFIRHAEGKLPGRIVRLLAKSTTEVMVSIVTPWEIAMKPALRKGGFSRERVREHLEVVGAHLLAVTLEHTERIYRLLDYHHEPFDHMIIAQALVENCPVISSDQRFPLYASEGLKVLWDD